MQMRQATPDQAVHVLALLVAAARWIEAQGHRQWRHYLDETVAQAVEILDAIAAGEVWLAWEGDRAVGTISLQMGPSDWDRTIWGAAASADAAYVHRFATDRAMAGQGFGGQMLDWAKAEARTRGKRYLRLDCVTENQPLNAYYRQRFRRCGEKQNIGMLFSRYEQAL